MYALISTALGFCHFFPSMKIVKALVEKGKMMLLHQTANRQEQDPRMQQEKSSRPNILHNMQGERHTKNKDGNRRG